MRATLQGNTLRNRWVILAIIFCVRLAMPFQFQSVAAVAPLLTDKFGLNLADIGLLIGLYFAPGIALGLPGGAIGQKFGDKATVLGALALMAVGSLAMAFGDAWHWQIAGRLVAGAGGVLLNVQLTKMVTDWFAGKEIATAMGAFVNSWPAGIALSLVTLPSIGTAYGVKAVSLVVLALIVLGSLLALTYQTPAQARPAGASSARLSLNTAIALSVAGLIWGLFNAAFAIVFSFGPTMLVERGWTIAQAGSAISIVLWIAVFSVPLGGVLADRFKRPQTMLVAGSIVFAALMLAFAHTSAVIAILIVLGVVSGQPAGPIMSLPSRVLEPATRALGMGLFYTIYYVPMVVGPVIAGSAAKWSGSASAAFDFGAVMLVICPPLLWVFNRISAPAAHPRLA
ncbi:MAG TPA: MFS transporter [Bradyrhizobium sp.]